MKKNRILFSTAWLVAGMLTMLVSCSKEEELSESGVDTTTADQTLRLQVESTRNGIATRAGRPLFGNDADQKVDYVALFFTHQSKDVYGDEQYRLMRKIILSWENAKSYDQNGHGKYLEFVFKNSKNGKLDDGDYRIYSVGYSSGSTYSFTPEVEEKVSDILLDETIWNDVFKVATQGDAEEVFAGQTDLHVEDGIFSVNTNNTIIMHRQVAGITGYFTNIPVSVNKNNSRFIRLVSINKNTTMKFGHFYSDFVDSTVSEAKYIVNGEAGSSPLSPDGQYSDQQSAYIVYDIDLNNWFPNVSGEIGTYKANDYNGDGFLNWKDIADYVTKENKEDYSAVWQNPHKGEASFVKGSVFSGKFVIPFEKGNTNTLQLQILANDHTTILKSWNIKAHTNQMHWGTQKQDEWERFDADTEENLNVSFYNIYRNHMYNVGYKASAAPGDKDPEKPDNEDKPVDLSSQELILIVDADWNDDIFDMEVETDNP